MRNKLKPVLFYLIAAVMGGGIFVILYLFSSIFLTNFGPNLDSSLALPITAKNLIWSFFIGFTCSGIGRFLFELRPGRG